MLDINLRQLEIFAAVTEYNSFTKAADALYMSQSTVSSYIQGLENILGVSLFNRVTKKKIELTDDGKRIYAMAQDILDRCQRLQDSTEENNPVPTLTIAASTVPSQFWLPKNLAEFSRENPDCHFLLRRGDSIKVHEMITKQEAQMGFVGMRMDEKKFTYTPVFRDEIVLITENAPRYQKYEKTDGLKILLQEPVITREEESGTWQVAKRWLHDKGITTEALNIVAKMENPGAICRVVKQGMGVSVISSLAVEEDVEEGKLLKFSLDTEGLFRQIYLVLSQKEKMPDMLKCFYEFIVSNESKTL